MTPVSRRDFLRGSLTATAAMAASSLGGASVLAQSGQPAGALPPSMKAVWDLSKAYRETTPTRELICINGLWRWHPGHASMALRLPG